jgi:hypothetical protein
MVSRMADEAEGQPLQLVAVADEWGIDPPQGQRSIGNVAFLVAA